MSIKIGKFFVIKKQKVKVYMGLKKEILSLPLIRLFVYGTLRKNQRFEFYLEGSEYVGKFYTRGQLMKSTNDNVYIDFAYNEAVTIGEVYDVNFYCLQRINHLEVLSGTFPKGYDLNVIPIWKVTEFGNYKFEEDKKLLSFFFKWKNEPVKILTGDYTDDFDIIDVIMDKIIELRGQVSQDDLLQYMQNRLSIYESYKF